MGCRGMEEQSERDAWNGQMGREGRTTRQYMRHVTQTCPTRLLKLNINSNIIVSKTRSD
jgi:hypothetical protein